MSAMGRKRTLDVSTTNLASEASRAPSFRALMERPTIVLPRILIGGLMVAAAAGCAAPVPLESFPGTIAPREAIVLAADAAPRAVPGLFAIPVRATGQERGRVYLNSELDYRDQRNLTISIDPGVAQALERRFGAPPQSFFKGKWIQVRGAAKRMTIGFFDDGKPTGLYYYQTHVRVSHPDQITVVARREP